MLSYGVILMIPIRWNATSALSTARPIIKLTLSLTWPYN